MLNLRQDIQSSIRLLIKYPLFSVATVLMLAIGIGANATIFSLINAVLFKELSVSRPQELANIYKNDLSGQGPSDFNFSYPDYLLLKQKNDVFKDVLAFAIFSKAFVSNNKSEVVYGNLVSGNYFGVLGVHPLMGRTLTAEDDSTLNGNPVAIISYSLWTRHFLNNPKVIGSAIRLNGRHFEIVGVMPENFRGIYWSTVIGTDVWAPISSAEQIGYKSDHLSRRDWYWLNLVGRIKEGVTFGRAQTSMALLVSQLQQANREYNRSNEYKVTVIPSASVRLNQRSDAQFTFIGVGLLFLSSVVLFITCLNLMNLFLAKMLHRRKEMAVRLALGASKAQLARQLLTECLLLSLLGGVFGLLLARWMTGILTVYKPLLPSYLRFNIDVAVDHRVLLFTIFVCLFTSILCGLIPALRATDINLVGELNNNILPASSKVGMKYWLLGPQIALSLLLMVVGGLFLRSLQKAKSTGLGFNPDHVAVVSFDLDLYGYKEASGKEFYQIMEERVKTLQGVSSACIADWPPIDDNPNRAGIYLANRLRNDTTTHLPYVARVTSEFFKALQIQFLQGRNFSEKENGSSRAVAIINETLANQLWPNQNVIGKQFAIDSIPLAERDVVKGQLVEVVGMVGNTKEVSPGKKSRPYLYLPFYSFYSPKMRLIIKTDLIPGSVFEPVRRLVKSLDASLDIVESRSMEEYTSFFLYPLSAAALLTNGLGLIGLLMSSVGVYSMTSFATTQKTREIAIRMAIGAQASSVLWVAIKDGLKMILIGVCGGLLLTIPIVKLLSTLLFGVTPMDALSFVGSALLLCCIVLLACYVPARRVIRIDPAASLRYE